MKQFTNLSTIISPLEVEKSTVELESSSEEGRKENLSNIMINSANQINNPSPDQSASSGVISMASSGAEKSSTDRKLLASRETPLSVLKISPLTMFINNKVGSSFGSQQQQQQQDALMSYNLQLQSFQLLPVTSRKVRNSGSLLFMLAFLSFLGYIIWDGIIVKDTDINLIVHGHDSYGNICGRKNRPIRFADKSGKDYSSKPYTKYTLINSQFERYTLDSSRLKNGELFYVRLEENSAESGVATKTTRATTQYRSSMANEVKQQARSRPIRSTRAFPFGNNRNSEEFLGDRQNQSVRNIKSTLMYQYPPLYGYNPIKQLEERRQNMFRNRDGSFTHSSSLETPLEGSASQIVHSFVQSATMYPKELRVTTLEPPNRTTNAITSTAMPAVVFFDDHPSDNERYEHTLVTPISTNFLATRTRDQGININDASSQLLYLTECVDTCPSDHVELIFYRCMPKNWRFSLFPNAINVTRTFIDDIITDVGHCYRELIYTFSLALVLSIALLILLRFLASFIIWSCLILLISLFLSMASYSWFSYYNQVVDLNNMMPHDSSYSDRLTLSDKWLIGSIFLTFLAFAAIGMVVFMRERILLVTKLFRESGKAIADMPLLLLQPVLTFAALVGITAIWSLGLICLQSMKVPIVDMSTGFVVYKAETLYKIMKWYHIFAFLWVSHFAIACQHYVIGAAVSKWYFSTNRYNLHSPIGSSVSELILYYFGSVALGSFLVAVFKVIRIVTRQIQYLVQRNCMSPSNTDETSANSTINSMHFSTSFCGSFSYVWRLFIWFFDNIVMIINRDAYVEIAIHGHSFVGGAQRAITVLASNPLRLLAIKSVSNILLVIAKICVVFGTVSMAVVLIEEKSHQLTYSWSPILISALYAYIVAHWFLSVYEMVIDALFICYCEDHERSKNQEANNQITGTNFMSQILNSNQVY